MPADEALAVETDWFAVDRVGQDLIQVSEPHVSPLVSANIWWLRGRRGDLVVDTGLGLASLRAQVPEMFTREPTAVVTHTHLDHVGGAHEFVGVAVHAAEALAVAAPPRASLDPAVELAILGLQVGADVALPPSLLRALPASGYDPQSYAVRPATVARRLQDGDLFDLGDIVLAVLQLPGHSPGSIALWDEARARLFTGDVIYDDELLDDMFGADIESYVASMRRLLELPVDMVYPGHGEPFPGPRLREIAADYIDRRTA
jgi:glyoxylase-like metal-dependent hydrolase (beta-lactamase superfamily II)